MKRQGIMTSNSSALLALLSLLTKGGDLARV